MFRGFGRHLKDETVLLPNHVIRVITWSAQAQTAQGRNTVTWMNVEINGETAATKVSDTYPHDLMPEIHADVLETVKVFHTTAGDFMCKYCNESWNDTNEDRDEISGQECPQHESETSPTGYGTHELEDASLSWFEEATVRVDDKQNEVSVAIEVNGKRFRISVHYAENIGEGGSLVLTLPGTSGTREVDGCTVVAD
jgi:hypothetical protein